ncbi:MAG: hypothetical protein ABIC57_03285 [bacterium]
MRIALDMDNVTVNYNGALEYFYNRKNNTCINFNEKGRPYSYAEFLGISKEQQSELLREFSQSQEFLEIKPMPGSVNGVQRLALNNDLWNLTARSLDTFDNTQVFVDEYFPNCINGIIMTGQSDPIFNYTLTKGIICHQCGFNLLIDDYIENAEEAASIGIPVILVTTDTNENLYTNPAYDNMIYRVDKNDRGEIDWDKIVETVDYMNKLLVGHDS